MIMGQSGPYLAKTTHDHGACCSRDACGAGGLGPGLHLGDGLQSGARGRDVVDAEDPGAEPGADGQGGDRALGSLLDWQGKGLADEVLVRDGDEDRPAGAGQLAQAPGDLERLPRVLAEVVSGSTRMADGLTPVTTARSA
jgi:hypothetical protein